jgi:hypothetical protein
MNHVVFDLGGVPYCIIQDERHVDFMLVRIDSEESETILFEGCSHQLAFVVRDLLLGILPGGVGK